VPSRHRWRRRATAVITIVAGLFLAYLAAVNLFLGTRLLRNIVSVEPDSFLLDYASAYSIAPGRVHVGGLTIRGGGRHVQWILTIDTADVVVAMTDLLHKRFHASRVRVNGFTIRVRFRMDPAMATPELLANLPPVPGFVDPPYTDVGPDPLPVPDALYHPWSVQIEDVDVEHVREIWIQAARAESDSRVHGRWIFRPGRWIDVGPATVDVNALVFSYEGRRLAAGVRGLIGGTLHPFDLREPGLEVLGHVSTDGHLHGETTASNVLATLAGSKGVDFAGGEGPLDARLVMDHGMFMRGTSARMEAARTEATGSRLSFAWAMQVELEAKDDTSSPGPIMSLRTAVSNLRISSRDDVLGDVASVDATLTGQRPELLHAFDDSAFSVDIHGARTQSLSGWAARFLPASGVAVGAGVATASAHLDGSLARKSAGGVFDFAVAHMTLKRGSEGLTSDVSGHVDLRKASLLDQTIDIRGVGVILENTDATSHDFQIRVPNISLQATRLLLALPKATVEADGTIVGEHMAARAARSAVLGVPSFRVVASGLTFAPARTTGRVSIDVPGAAISDIHGLARVLRLRSDVEFEGGRVDARGHVDIDLGAGSAQGDGEVVGRSIRARFGTTTVASDVTAELKARRGGSAQSGSIDLSGSTVAIANGSTERGGDPWWGTFALSNAVLQTKGGMTFRANISGTGKDASPATALIADNTATPAWAANIFRMPNLRTQAEVRATSSSIEVRSLIARGEGASIRMEYAKWGGRHEGALLLDVGWVEMGYDLTQDSTGLVVLGSEGWFAKKTTMIREHTPLN
jgi:hypothetical protein